MKEQGLRLCSVLLMAWGVSGCAAEYSATEIEAWVVDKDTGEPIPGVNVVAHWSLEFGAEGGSQHDLELMEAVTDKNGRFYFPAWGPKEYPEGVPWSARLEKFDPEIILFKRDYWPMAVYNDSHRPPYSGHGPKVRRSLWHGKKIKLERFPGDWELYGRTYAGRVGGALTGTSYAKCQWKKMPRMIASLDLEARRLEQIGIRHRASRIIDDLSTPRRDEECGPVKDFFRDYLNEQQE